MGKSCLFEKISVVLHQTINEDMQQTGTAACNMRDELWKAYSGKRITLSQITKRMQNREIPDWLQSQIIQMVRYREGERTTDPVEQAMAAAVYYHIVKRLKDEDYAEWEANYKKDNPS